jgi:hypothetical protein
MLHGLRSIPGDAATLARDPFRPLPAVNGSRHMREAIASPTPGHPYRRRAGWPFRYTHGSQIACNPNSLYLDCSRTGDRTGCRHRARHNPSSFWP